MEASDRSEVTTKPSVLVVDDEASVATVLARGLSYAGYDTTVACSGEEALKHLNSRRFDALLTDIHMPRMRGDELQRIARERDPDLAVLLITAAQDISGAVECLKEGVSDYMTKPFDLNDVSVRVSKALERRRLERENRNYQVGMERRVAELTERHMLVLQSSLAALIQALEAKDPYTRNHSQRVSTISTALALRLCPDDPGFAAKVKVAALFHDIGKIGVPEAILNKPGKLDEAEMAQVRRHPELGLVILRPLFEDPQILAIVRNHHEQWDGGGYPDGLLGEETEPGACIVAVADSYDAMTSARAYRPGMPPARALQILREGAGKQWDPDVVTGLLEMAEAGELGKETQQAAAQETLSADRITLTQQEAAPPSDEENKPWTRISRVRPVLFIDSELNEEVQETLRMRVAALIGQGDSRFILDLRQAGFLYAADIQFIYLLHLRAEEAGGQMAVRDAPDHALIAFRKAGLAQVLHFEQSPLPGINRAAATRSEERKPHKAAA